MLLPPGVRVVTPRTGVVFSRSGGALGRLLPLLRCGIGGPLGHGRQYWPWVTLPDVVRGFPVPDPFTAHRTGQRLRPRKRGR